jgi:hypothetical protein
VGFSAAEEPEGSQEMRGLWNSQLFRCGILFVVAWNFITVAHIGSLIASSILESVHHAMERVGHTHDSSIKPEDSSDQ